jgi:hypothetical protein
MRAKGRGIEVKGLNKLVRDLKTLDADLVDSIKQVNAKLADEVASTAKIKVPRLSGALAASIRSSGQGRTGVVRAGGRAVPYAGPIHFGWAKRNIRPQPFLYDALDARRVEVATTWVRELERIVGKVN